MRSINCLEVDKKLLRRKVFQNECGFCVIFIELIYFGWKACGLISCRVLFHVSANPCRTTSYQDTCKADFTNMKIDPKWNVSIFLILLFWCGNLNSCFISHKSCLTCQWSISNKYLSLNLFILEKRSIRNTKSLQCFTEKYNLFDYILQGE